MKIRFNVFKLFVTVCSVFLATSVFGQTTFTWTGAADGTNFGISGNWSPVGLPSGVTQDTAQWDGLTTSNLVISVTTLGFPNTGFGTVGINLVLTPNQTNSVQIISSAPQSSNIGIFGITNNSSSVPFILGDTTGNRLNFVTRPAGVAHYLDNNSTAPSTFDQSVRLQAGGGAVYTLAFGGTGDWIVNNYLRNDNNAGSLIEKDGPGTLTWTAAGFAGNSPINSPVVINGGTVILKSSGLLGNQNINHNGTALRYDAFTQAQTLSGIISGTGLLQVNNGTLTLSGQSTFTGNTLLSGGTLVVNGAENAGVSGPLGVGGTISFAGGTLGFSVNNVFDYSSRFSTAASQAYSFDTGGQSVTLATGLSSSGGTLTKSGSGTITLSGTSSYSGTTTVSAGRLVFQGSKTGSGSITVADSAALGVTDTGTQVTPGALIVGTSGSATLEFNNVNSTTTAPVAADSVSTAGTIFVNINSGTFVPGQSYPLFSWTNGSAPAVSPGSVNGALGTLTTNGTTIRFNVTTVTLVWTGATSGNWTDPNNWTQTGIPITYFNPSPALFDDTASGTTAVTVDALVLPTSVTVNNSSKTYSITSSGGNNIAGSGSLTKRGSGTLTLAGGANTYTGITTISDGTLRAGALANGGAASDLGAAGSAAANLVLNGGALQYTGGPTGINRSFTLTTGGGAIDASGSGALNLNNSGALGYSGSGPRALTLMGANSDSNTLAAPIANNGGATSLTKNGAGKWVLTGNSTYSGVTTIANGVLQVGAGGAGGSVGTGNVVDNSALVFNRTGTLTVSAVISGPGSVTNDGTGTVILSADNTYTGGTTINTGTLQVGNGGATGKLDSGSPIVNNSTIVFNSAGAFTIRGAGVISGSGNLIKRGSGVLKAIGANTYSGWTTIDAGATFQPCEGNQGALASSVVTNNGTLKLVRQDNGVFIYTGSIVGFGQLVKDVNNPNLGDVTLTGTNSYTGGTAIVGGGIIIGNGGFSGSIVGNVTFVNSAVSDTFRSLAFNRADDITFSGTITGPGGTGSGGAVANAGSVIQNGLGVLTLTGNNTYLGGSTINSGTLQVGNGGTSGSIGTGPVVNNSLLIFNRSDDVNFPAAISGGGGLTKLAAGKLTIGTNSYTGTTTVSNGTLIVNGDNLATSTIVYGGTLGGAGPFSGPVTLQAGTTLAPGASVGTMTVNSDLSIGGNLAIDVNKSLSPSNDMVVVSGTLANTGTGTLTVSNLGPPLVAGDKFTLFSQPVTGGGAITVTGAGATWVNNLAVDGSITVTAITRPTLNFTQAGNNLQFSWNTSFGTYKLQAQTNSLSVGISNNWADYPGGSNSPVTVPIVLTNEAVFFRLVPFFGPAPLGQGFVYDQQSTTSNTGGGVLGSGIQDNQPFGQSFVPTLSSVGFVRLSLAVPAFPGGVGATVYVNLWAGAIGTGTLLGSTEKILLPVGFDTWTIFFFSPPVIVNPGTTYYFQPVAEAGSDIVNVGLTTPGTAYTNGTAIFFGVPIPSYDLWFREGMVVP